MTCQSNNIAGSCGCNAFSYNTQIPASVPPLSRYYIFLNNKFNIFLIKISNLSNNRSSYSFTTNTPSVPCPQTYQNFGYQLQVPVAPKCEPNFGSFDGIIDKIYTKCPTSCQPVR